MLSNKRRTRRSAFTLIELLLVLVILAVLATIVVLNFGSIFGQADETKANTDIATLETGVELYHSALHDYPATLEALVQNTTGSPDWKGPYVKKGLPNDPWGHPYNYACPGTHNTYSFDIWSNGDGKKQIEGLDNWTVKKK